jgi:arylsulfatase A-like enzyme
MERSAATLAVRGGALRGEIRLARHAGAVRVLDLDWAGVAGSELTLTGLAVREQRPVLRPPIVFVSIDTFAARHLALYGYGRATSPELERFQRDAVLFERCLANAPWTLPSYLSVMSGLYPRAHAVALQFQAGADIAPQDLWQLADNRWTLAEALRARGYRTAGFVDTQWLAPVFRVQQGFDVYNGEGATAEFTDPRKHIVDIVERLVPPWLATCDATRPPFLFVHALDAHGPYLPDAPFRDAFTRALPAARTSVPAGSDNQTYRWMPWWMSRTLQPDESLPEAPSVPLEEVVARYDESLLKVDAYLGKLFDHLRARGLYDESVIVVTGDHGEHFGPEAYGHGLMRESVLHVPLLLKLPGNEHGGLRVERPVALVDVYPTLLALAGVPPEPSRLHGESLLPLLEGARPDGERAFFSEGGHVEQYALTQGCWRLVEEFPGSESSDAALLSHPRVSDDWLRANCPELLERPLSKALLKEILARPGFTERLQELRKLVAGPYHALFDLCSDPEERHDLAARQPEVLARLKLALEAEKARARGAQREAEVSGVREALSGEARAQLEALGYGGGGPDEQQGAPPPRK